MKNRTLRKKFSWNSYWLAFLLPFLGYVGVMIFAGHKPFGSSSILYSDMYHQYFPFFVEFRQVLRSGGSLQFNWSVGMGIDYLPLISYYLASPLNLFSVLLPESWLLSYFSLLVPIKLGIAGLFFSMLLRKLYGGEGLYASLFSTFYALCSWALGYQWNIMWLDTFALLPLVILGEVYLLRDKKFVLYTLTLFLAVACNYYIGFFVCIFVALVFICYEIGRWKGFGRFFSDLVRIALFSLLGLCMTAFLEVPAYLGLQNTYSSVNKFPTTFDLNITSNDTFAGLLDALRQVFGNMGGGEPTFKEGLPNIYCGVLTGILAVLFCTQKKIRLREKVMSVCLLLFFALSFILRQLDYIWHGFHFTNMIPYRFSFLFSFVLILMAYRAFLLMDQVRPWQIILSSVLFLGICALSNDRFSPLFLAYNLGFILIYTAVLFLRSMPGTEKQAFVKEEKPKVSWKTALSLVMAGETICALVCFGVGFGGTGISNYPRGTTDTAELLKPVHAAESDSDFFRTEFTHSQTLNDGALNGVNGISLFSSAANVNMTIFMAALGFGAKPSYNRYLYEDASPVANAFLNLKYLIDRNDNAPDETYWTETARQGSVVLYENNAYLPLGFMAESTLAALDVSSPTSGSLSFQNDLFSLATGSQEKVIPILEAAHIVSNGIQLTTSTSSTGYCSYNDAVDGDTVTYCYEIPYTGNLCIDVSGSKKNSFTVYRNGEAVLDETIGLPQIFSAGSFKAGDKCEITFRLSAGDSGNLEVTAGVVDDSLFRSGIEKLSRGAMEITEFTDTRITASVQADKLGVLYTSIPYDENWTAYVDGEKADVTVIGGAMLGLTLEAGSHTIVFRYQNQGFLLGLKISAAAFAAFGALCLLSFRPWTKKNRSAEKQ